MELNSWIDKALSELKKILNENPDYKNINLEKSIISINNGKKDIAATIFALTITIFLPFSFLSYMVIFKDSFIYPAIITISFVLLFGYDFLKILKSEKSLTINLSEKNIEVVSSNKILGRLFPKRKITFSEIMKTEIVKKSVRHKYTSTKWQELVLTNTESEKIILSSFNTDYPESEIGRRVKLIIDTLKWNEKGDRI